MKTLTNQLDALEKKSIQIILENQSSTGGYVASPNFAVYNYSWFRDGAFIAHAMLLAGEIASAEAFHLWAAENINKRSKKISDLIARNTNGEAIDPEDHLHCRYSTDGKESKEEWTNFQLDGFGTWLWSLNKYRLAGNDLHPSFLAAAEKLVPYLKEFWAAPSFDWWEESFGQQHVSTLGCISAGLAAVKDWNELPESIRNEAEITAAEIKSYVMSNGVHAHHLTKWIGSSEVDASLSALIAPLNWIDVSDVATKTLDEIAQQLGEFGTHRHLTDVYFGGGPWPLLSAFLALSRLAQGDIATAEETLIWIAGCANDELELPEQLSTNLLHPETRSAWIEKWGIPAEPLLWSHAMFLILKKEVEKKSND